MSTGAKPPVKAAEDTLETGVHHLDEDLQLTFLKNIYGALLLSAGGILSLIIETGSPSLIKANPGMGHILQGITFPIGLVLVYFVGAELYTGYPMWFMMTALERKGRPIQYIRVIVASWLGNLLGALIFAGCFTYLTDVLSEEPFKSGTIELVDNEIVNQSWHIIFMRSIPCGWLVTFSMLLGTQNHDGISKALALHLPFFVATAASMPHLVKFMYLGLTAMMLGAPIQSRPGPSGPSRQEQASRRYQAFKKAAEDNLKRVEDRYTALKSLGETENAEWRKHTEAQDRLDARISHLKHDFARNEAKIHCLSATINNNPSSSRARREAYSERSLLYGQQDTLRREVNDRQNDKQRNVIRWKEWYNRGHSVREQAKKQLWDAVQHVHNNVRDADRLEGHGHDKSWQRRIFDRAKERLTGPLNKRTGAPMWSLH
ncbi:hypothetical protein MBLNU457_1525t1 [Dothideomycetes sp. NU457]